MVGVKLKSCRIVQWLSSSSTWGCSSAFYQLLIGRNYSRVKMSDFLAQSMFSLGIIKLARSITELAIAEANSDYESAVIPLAFLDSIYSSELVVRASILKIELAGNLSTFGESTVSEIRKIELINGSSRLSFLELPKELERVSGRLIANSTAYYEMNHLRKELFSEDFHANQLVEPTLRFAFESIEPLAIDMWGDIILMHIPELDFEVDKHIETLLAQYDITASERGDLPEDE